jgi:hypothetical protein
MKKYKKQQVEINLNTSSNRYQEHCIDYIENKSESLVFLLHFDVAQSTETY